MKSIKHNYTKKRMTLPKNGGNIETIVDWNNLNENTIRDLESELNKIQTILIPENKRKSIELTEEFTKGRVDFFQTRHLTNEKLNKAMNVYDKLFNRFRIESDKLAKEVVEYYNDERMLKIYIYDIKKLLVFEQKMDEHASLRTIATKRNLPPDIEREMKEYL